MSSKDSKDKIKTDDKQVARGLSELNVLRESMLIFDFMNPNPVENAAFCVKLGKKPYD